MTTRYGLYYAPALDSELWRKGSAVLGYDAAAKQPVAKPEFLAAGRADLSKRASGYGFHATLKQPIALREGLSEADLLTAAKRFSDNEAAFALPALEVSDLFGHLALTPRQRDQALIDYAGRVVAYFEPFRPPLSAYDRERRLANAKTPEALGNLDTWGYPFVFGQFPFHMTLTDKLDEQELSDLKPKMADYFEHILAQPHLVSCLTVYKQPDTGAAFEVIEQFAFSKPRR